MTNGKLPQSNTAAYRAAAHLSKSGPLSRANLFAQVQMSELPCNRIRVLRRALDSGWLVESFGKVDCSDVMRAHFDGQGLPPEIAPVGQKAESRTNSFYDRPVLKYRTNSKGFRDDIPAFSVREGQSFRSVPGGQS